MNTRNKKWLATTLAAGVFAVVGWILAAPLSGQPGPNNPGQQACRADVERLCSNVERGDRPAMHACLREHREELSEPCRNFITQRMEQFQNACGNDMRQFCSEHRGNPQAMRQCMREHRDQLEPT